MGGRSLTLAVIAKNEADRIADCLRSVPCADELLVLDSGSTDATVSIARDCGARVLETDWPGFVAQKNRALESARGDVVLSLDADERLSPEALQEVERVLASRDEAHGWSFPRCSTWLGRPIRHGRWYPDRKVRLVCRGQGHWAGRDPHDRLVVAGVVRRLAGDILHDPYRDFSEHLGTIDRYARLSAESLHAEGRRGHVWDVVARPPLHFVDAYLLRRGFLDGLPGLALAGLGAAHVGLKWSRLRRVGGSRQKE